MKNLLTLGVLGFLGWQLVKPKETAAPMSGANDTDNLAGMGWSFNPRRLVHHLNPVERVKHDFGFAVKIVHDLVREGKIHPRDHADAIHAAMKELNVLRGR